MSHTNQTPNYHLPQFIGTDKPAWLVDFNQSMSDIDTQMKANETASATAEANAQSALSGVTALNSQVGGLQTDVTAIQTQMPLDEAKIATNAQNISTQASAIVNANNRIDTANTDITALNTKVGDLSALDTTDKTSIVNAVNEVNADLTWKFIDEVTVTGATGATNSKTVTIPSSAKELLVVVGPNNIVVASSVGLLSNGYIDAGTSVPTSTGDVGTAYYGEFDKANSTLKITIQYRNGADLTVSSSLYYR